MVAVPNKKSVLLIVYFSILLDNILLTVVGTPTSSWEWFGGAPALPLVRMSAYAVPIVPDYLISVESPRKAVAPWIVSKNRTMLQELEDENGKVGFLLSSKAVVQIIFNPFVGCVARYVGYTMPLFFGTVNLLASSLLYAIGESYTALFLARSLQGVSSACIGVSGMCLVAEHYTDERQRSKVMGITLGSVALGVLLGYPYGGFSYDYFGKMAPFLGISTLAIINIGDQRGGSDWKRLLSDKMIMVSAGAIWISSSAMAVLEPCLPLWLMSNIHPQKWELGTVFIPDSIGYLIGTNFFGGIAYMMGRWTTAIAALILVAVSSCILPTARSIGELVIPHAGLGLGIGVVDSALVPLMATLVDTRHRADYATVYAIQQTSVSLAYALAPMFGGELVKVIGFPWLMRLIGLINILYTPLLLILAQAENQESKTSSSGAMVSYKSTENIHNYNRFIDSDESD